MLETSPTPAFIGESEVFQSFLEKLRRAATVNRPVLIVGERGTGKELAAIRLTGLSARWQVQLVTLNCAALAPTLIESELFGYEAGAFTGAGKRRRGRFEAADGGTLFLDEIGNIPLDVQVKILRVVEYQTFERVGGSEPVRVDVRIIGATNADLPALAEAGKFKKDLLDRLSFEVVHVPPLRARGEDIMELALHFGVRMALELGWAEAPFFSSRAEEELMGYSWPGNVRELKNVVERAVYRSEDPLIDRIDFNPFSPPDDWTRPEPPTNPKPEGDIEAAEAGRVIVASKAEAEEGEGPDLPGRPLPEQTAALEKRLIREALEKTGHNQKKAAGLLGLTYHQFRGLYRKYGFSR